MKKGILIIFLIYITIFCFLQISSQTKLDNPNITINGKDINYFESVSYHQILIPFVLETKDEMTNGKMKEEIIINDDEITLSTNIDESANMIIKQDTKQIYNGKVTSNIGVLLNEGNYDIIIEIDEEYNFYSHKKSIYEFRVTVEKSIKSEINTKEVKRGNYVVLTIDNVLVNDSIRIISDLKNKISGIYEEGSLIAYYPIAKDEKLGSHKIEIYNQGELVNTHQVKVVANDREFASVRDIKIEAGEGDIDEVNNTLTTIFKKSIDNKLWTNSFAWPVSGEVSADINSKVHIGNKTYEHTGIDIKTKKGTPVKSVADGKIVLARKTSVLGNVVIIDHGHYLYTVYGHLDVIDVKENDKVNKEMIIGKSGTYLEEELLHFGINFGNVALDPYSFLRK